MAKVSTDTVQEFKALREEILRGDIKPFYLLFGKEHYYIDELARLLQEQVVPPGERDFGQLVYYGADVTANQVVSAARQFPMMTARQIVMVKEAQMMKKVEDIALYFEGIQPTTVLVVCYKTNNDPAKSGRNIDKRSTFYKQAKKYGIVFESNPIPDYRIARWIDGYVSELGLRIAPDAAALLAESAGSDLQKLALSIDKLRKSLPEDRKDIGLQDIEENVGVSRDYSAFELTKALSLKDPVKAFRIVRFFADSPKRFPIQMTMAALSGHFIRLLRYHALLLNGIPRNELLAQLGINPYFASEYETAVRNYPVKKVMQIISLLKEYDQRSKSNTRGEATDGDLLQELTAKILA